jgi:hypothetical protein
MPDPMGTDVDRDLDEDRDRVDRLPEKVNKPLLLA